MKNNLENVDEHLLEQEEEKSDFEASKKQNLVDSMEKFRLLEYAMYINNPWKLLGMNFLIGLSRGLGGTLGLGLVLAVIVFAVQHLISANLPGISQWLAELLSMVQEYQK